MEPLIKLNAEPKRPSGWIVQRYSGASVGKFGVKIAEDIVKVRTRRNRVAIVCSAITMGCEADEGFNGITDQLLHATEAALDHQPREFLKITGFIEKTHVRVANELISSAKILEHLIESISDECNHLIRLLGAVQILNEMSPKTRDKIVGAGERLSCMLMVALLEDRGIDAECVDLDGIVDSAHIVGNDFGQEIYENFSRRLLKRIQECDGKVPVVMGYLNAIPGMTIGKDYTDICAAMLAIGLDANELQVWKETDGIFTADPRVVSSARLIRRITADEASELTYSGMEIIQSVAMELVTPFKIPIRIKNVHNSLDDGTVIFHRTTLEDRVLEYAPRKPTAIAIKNGIVLLNIHSNKQFLSYGFFTNIFSTLQRWHLVPNLISTSEVHVSMALGSFFIEDDFRKALEELKQLGTVQWTRNLAIISLVGIHMRRLVGTAGCMFSALAEEGVNVEMISQGVSEINISCVVKEEDAARAMSILHTRMVMHRQDIS